MRDGQSYEIRSIANLTCLLFVHWLHNYDYNSTFNFKAIMHTLQNVEQIYVSVFQLVWFIAWTINRKLLYFDRIHLLRNDEFNNINIEIITYFCISLVFNNTNFEDSNKNFDKFCFSRLSLHSWWSLNSLLHK